MSITIRNFRDDDAAFLESAFADARIWGLTEDPPPLDLAMALGQQIEQCWIAELDGMPVGSCSIIVGRGAHQKQGEWGGWLLPEAMKRGVATEALRLALVWAQERGLVRVESRPAADNLLSHAVLERAGMRLESIAADAFYRRGKVLDEFVYVWTKEK